MNEHDLAGKMAREDLDKHPTAIVFRRILPVRGQTWLRVTIETTSYIAQRGSTPFVVTRASDGMRLCVNYPTTMHIETDALCTVPSDFPYEMGHQRSWAETAASKTWIVGGGLLPMQGLELMWYPIDDKKKYHVRAVWYHVWSKGRYDRVEKLVSDDYCIRESSTAMRPHVGRGALVDLVRSFRDAFDHLVFSIDAQTLRDDDCIETRWRASGRHTGQFHELAPTGLVLESDISGITVSKVDVQRGLVLSEEVTWDYADLLDLLRSAEVSV